MITIDTFNNELEIQIYDKNLERPRCLKFIRNKTPLEIATEIEDNLPHDLKNQFEYSGISTILQLIPSEKQAVEPIAENGNELSVVWKTGNSEGYYVEVLASDRDRNQTPIWSAKMFDISLAIKTHLMLSAWINNTGTVAANAMRDIYNSIKID